jgi:uncharacterized membrane protein YeiH
MGAFSHLSPGLLLEGSAVIVSALSAMITAAKKEMDFVGVYALAVVTSFGGGTVRDLLLDRRPFFWVERWEYLVIVLALCVPFVYSRRLYRWSATFVARADVVDALGLGFFTVSGTALAAHAGMPAIVCALLGVMTGTGGGVMRDLITNEIPTLFQHGRLHATAAVVGAGVYLVPAGRSRRRDGCRRGAGDGGAPARRALGWHLAPAPTLAPDGALARPLSVTSGSSSGWRRTAHRRR